MKNYRGYLQADAFGGCDGIYAGSDGRIVEAPWQELTLEERAARIVAERQTRSRPPLDGFRGWLESEAPKVLPKNAARTAAIHFSLLVSCKRHGHDPFVYLRDALTRQPAATMLRVPPDAYPMAASTRAEFVTETLNVSLAAAKPSLNVTCT